MIFHRHARGGSVISLEIRPRFLKICNAMIIAVAQVAQKLEIRWCRGDASRR